MAFFVERGNLVILRERRLERTKEAIDEISWNVGYEDPAFFRRLFKRLTGITPGAYRRKFKVPSVVTGTLPSGRAEALSHL